MRWVVAHPELLSDHLRYPLARPYTPPETVRLGSLCQKLGQFSAFLLAQTGCRSGWRLVSQALHTLLSGTLHPLAESPFSYPQSVGYFRLFLALLL